MRMGAGRPWGIRELWGGRGRVAPSPAAPSLRRRTAFCLLIMFHLY